MAISKSGPKAAEPWGASQAGADPIRPEFQLITMIDVTQQVTDDAELQAILTRARSLLEKVGVFIVTFWNQVRFQEDFDETFRPFSLYTAALAGTAYTQPVRFRDKFRGGFLQSRTPPR